MNSPLICGNFSSLMESEHELCIRFEVELARIAALDRIYYLNPSPSLAERREFAQRIPPRP
jgi:hypothetical protein